MKIEDIWLPGTVARQDRISHPAMVQDKLECPQADMSDDAPDEPMMVLATRQPVWPRVWPSL
jgi:hypothetical protein